MLPLLPLDELAGLRPGMVLMTLQTLPRKSSSSRFAAAFLSRSCFPLSRSARRSEYLMAKCHPEQPSWITVLTAVPVLVFTVLRQAEL